MVRGNYGFLCFYKVEKCSNRGKKVKLIHLARLKQKDYSNKRVHFLAILKVHYSLRNWIYSTSLVSLILFSSFWIVELYIFNTDFYVKNVNSLYISFSVIFVI